MSRRCRSSEQRRPPPFRPHSRRCVRHQHLRGRGNGTGGERELQHLLSAGRATQPVRQIGNTHWQAGMGTSFCDAAEALAPGLTMVESSVAVLVEIAETLEGEPSGNGPAVGCARNTNQTPVARVIPDTRLCAGIPESQRRRQQRGNRR
jgi:hypothetical protein